MGKLALPQDLAEQFAAGLLAVIRADHEIQPSEGRAIQDTVAELIDGVTVDFADAMLLRVSSESFASSVGAAIEAGQTLSPVTEVAAAFRTAADRVAGSDGSLSISEARVVNRYVNALNVLAKRFG